MDAVHTPSANAVTRTSIRICYLPDTNTCVRPQGTPVFAPQSDTSNASIVSNENNLTMLECDYHSNRRPSWGCAPCARRYCTSCYVFTESDTQRGPRCPLCDEYLDYLGSGITAEPFWRVAPARLLYPLAPPPLMLIGFVALLSPLFPQSLMVGLFTLLLAVALTTKYCFAVVNLTAIGRNDPPDLKTALNHDEDNLFIQFLGALIALVFLQAIVTTLLGNVAGLIFAVALTLFIPAIAIYVVMERSLVKALNVGELVRTIRAIGPNYAVVVILSNLISTGPYILYKYIDHPALANSFVLAVLGLAAAYIAIVNFALLGQLLLEHQIALGYVAGEPTDVLVPAAPANRRKQLLGRVAVLAEEGRYRDAVSLMESQGKEFANEGDKVFYHRHLNLALQAKDQRIAARLVDPQLDQLVAGQSFEPAIELWRKVAGALPDYRPGNAETCHRLALAAYKRKFRKEALQLLSNMHKRSPDYPHMGKAYRLAVRLLLETGRKKDAAKLHRFVAAQGWA